MGDFLEWENILIVRSKMYVEERTKTMFWHYIVFVPILLILYFCGFKASQIGVPIVIVAALITWGIYSLWNWKNRKELFIRFILTFPFSFLTIVLLRLIGFELYHSFYFAALVFILLTRKVKFSIGVVTAAILVPLLVFLIFLINSLLADSTR
jgi:hypothetical protein